MHDEDFDQLLVAMRPKLHRYCARMTGSAIDGDDVVQDALIKASIARQTVVGIDNPEGWLFRIAQNAALDFLRKRTRSEAAKPDEILEVVAAPEPDASDPQLVAASFRMFMELPTLQRCAVILKDVLGYSIEEIAEITEASAAAVKSALQRGRARLKELAHREEDVRLPLLSDEQRARLLHYVDMFRTGNFDAIRRLLAHDVKLDLVARLTLEGRDKIDPYFTRYAQARHWRFAAGVVDGQPVMLVFDVNGPMNSPSHFVVLDWRFNQLTGIRDFLFAPYALEGSEWLRLS